MSAPIIKDIPPHPGRDCLASLPWCAGGIAGAIHFGAGSWAGLALMLFALWIGRFILDRLMWVWAEWSVKREFRKKGWDKP